LKLLWFGEYVFSKTSQIAIVDLNTFFAPLEPPHEGCGEVVFGEILEDPLQHSFELCKAHTWHWPVDSGQ
jgi:hypothetical protein